MKTAHETPATARAMNGAGRGNAIRARAMRSAASVAGLHERQGASSSSKTSPHRRHPFARPRWSSIAGFQERFQWQRKS
jgi:hypothetical protein